MRQAVTLRRMGWLLGFLVGMVPVTATACGFHSKETIAKAFLNVTYPNALYVTGAIWSAQQAGLLPMPDPKRLRATGNERRRLDAKAYFEAINSLQSLGAAFNLFPNNETSKAVVLVETALWTRYSEGGQTEFHAAGPRKEDLVIVTGTPVIHAIKRGNMPIGRAYKSGYLRLYGSPEQKNVFLAAYSNVGKTQLPETKSVHLRTMMLGKR